MMLSCRTGTLLVLLTPLVVALALVARVVLAFSPAASLPADCALVFGAAVHWDDVPGPGILRRTITAAKLMREGKVHRLILSGGRGDLHHQSEAEIMRRVAIREGVDPERIVLEDQSRSTWENLVYARPLLEDCTSVVAVSDAYHLARIRYLAAAQGWGSLSTYPASDLPRGTFLLRSVTREVSALLYFMVATRAPLRERS